MAHGFDVKVRRVENGHVVTVLFVTNDDMTHAEETYIEETVGDVDSRLREIADRSLGI